MSASSSLACRTPPPLDPRTLTGHADHVTGITLSRDTIGAGARSILVDPVCVLFGLTWIPEKETALLAPLLDTTEGLRRYKSQGNDPTQGERHPEITPGLWHFWQTSV